MAVEELLELLEGVPRDATVFIQGADGNNEEAVIVWGCENEDASIKGVAWTPMDDGMIPADVRSVIIG